LLKGEKMEIHLNITFPKIPCELLTLDVMDVSGDQQTGVMHGVHKLRLAPQEEGGRILDIKSIDLYVLWARQKDSMLTIPQT
jgi:endoplasmic reticulum-Golgi intermediate compartment protein 3